jgi:DNA polymerase-3 subunit delta'
MEIIGHQKIVASLAQKIENQSYSQAYIFFGPEGVGKHFLAENFARGIIGGGQAELDILRVSPEREEKKGVIKEKEISVDQIKEKQKELATFPYSGNAKFLIVDDADRMTIKAQNAMLKTIEEPNSTAVIILIVSRLEKILPTVKSRCQIINFNLVSQDDMRKYFLDQKLAPNQELIDFSMGRPGMMLAMMEDPEKIEWYRNARKKMESVLNGGMNVRMKVAEELSKNVPEALESAHFWLWLLEKSGNIQNILRAEKIKEMGDKLKNTNVNARLLMENTFLNL